MGRWWLVANVIVVCFAVLGVDVLCADATTIRSVSDGVVCVWIMG